MSKILYKDLSYKIIGGAMQVHKELGYGFLEKVYENALKIIFEEKGIYVEQQQGIKVIFHKKEIGKYIADLIVEDKIILELKATKSITNIHKAQLANYLKGTNKRLGMILNFGRDKLEFQRVIL